MSQTRKSKPQSAVAELNHTPLRWYTEETSDHGHYRIMDEQEVTITLCYQQSFDTWQARDNARIIVRAVMNHAALLESLPDRHQGGLWRSSRSLLDVAE